MVLPVLFKHKKYLQHIQIKPKLYIGKMEYLLSQVEQNLNPHCSCKIFANKRLFYSVKPRNYIIIETLT